MIVSDIVSLVHNQLAVGSGHLTLDHRHLRHGDVFLALSGGKHNGRQFIQQAFNVGARAVLYDPCGGFVVDDARAIAVEDLSRHCAEIAAQYYHHPSRSVELVGVTGTNGKTTVSCLLAQGLQCVGHCAGMVGTLGHGIWPHTTPHQLTTPDAVAIQRYLANLVNQGARYVALEASSHALSQRRLDQVDIDVAVFTNLSQDHLDYHETMQQYAQEKEKLFLKSSVQCHVINRDDSVGRSLIKRSRAPSMIDYGVMLIDKVRPQVFADNIRLKCDGAAFDLYTPWGNEAVNINLLGSFNVSNVLAVVSVLGYLGVSFEQITQALSQLLPVDGRMSRVCVPDKPQVIVDFAHTPAALEQVLACLRASTQGKLWCVFGCGGDRDQEKRPLMGRVAEQFADHIILTNDNPRGEDPLQIMKDIRSGLSAKASIKEVSSRQEAIAYAVQSAHKNDIVLIAGKGHESVQIIKDQVVPCDDLQIVKQVLI